MYCLPADIQDPHGRICICICCYRSPAHTLGCHVQSNQPAVFSDQPSVLAYKSSTFTNQPSILTIESGLFADKRSCLQVSCSTTALRQPAVTLLAALLASFLSESFSTHSNLSRLQSRITSIQPDFLGRGKGGGRQADTEWF